MNTLFSIFASLALVCASMVIRARNPVHSVLFLILAFVSASALLVLADLDFFALVYLVVYVGAIAVLFLFVVMMLNLRVAVRESALRYFPVGGLIGIIFLLEVFYVVDEHQLVPRPSSSAPLTYGQTHGQMLESFTQWSDTLESVSTIEAIGLVLYTHYFAYFLLAGLILLIAMVGGITLTMHKGAEGKKQEISIQNRRDPSRTVAKIREGF